MGLLSVKLSENAVFDADAVFESHFCTGASDEVILLDANADETEEEIRNCDMLDEVARYLAVPFHTLCYTHDGFDEAKKKFFGETLPKLLDLLEKFLGCSHWIIGDKMTYVDFYLCEVFDCIQLMTSDCLDKHQGMKKYVERFYALDKIAAYRRSSRFKKWPFMTPLAKWGGKCEE
ncbi:unnamed protein product [Clavelina lepadiformis]|uniref:glutathione transferase n=1 Tax=Clavelina lepadiformis TaxID=159417 RepID=A0ABP0FI58_CLALP